MATHRLTARVLSDEAQLRAVIGTPNAVVQSKIAPRLNAATRRFVEVSPFVCLATSAPDGSCDVSPRGDAAGFVRIVDDATLLMPDRPGNKLADSLRNILRNPHVGLLFVIPGVVDSFRVNGRAAITDDPDLLAPFDVEGKVPALGILVDIDEAYPQCGKAFLRSHLWDSSRHIDRASLPTFGEIHAALDATFDADGYDAERAARYARRDGFY